MVNNMQDTVDSLDDLLDEERTALLDGKLDQIGRMLKRKESLIDVLNGSDQFDIEALSNLNIKVVRNQGLLTSALEGIQSVADRLAAMRRIKNSLDTYDAQGRRKEIDMPLQGVVEKRA
jgi:flagellar biosynthesis/type III secretory pathway chaperone